MHRRFPDTWHISQHTNSHLSIKKHKRLHTFDVIVVTSGGRAPWLASSVQSLPPSQKRLIQLKPLFFFKALSSYTVFNISIISFEVFPNFTRNLMFILCSVNSSLNFDNREKNKTKRRSSYVYCIRSDRPFTAPLSVVVTCDQSITVPLFAP